MTRLRSGSSRPLVAALALPSESCRKSVRNVVRPRPLPNGAVRTPDASWVSHARLASVAPERRSRFLPLCSDFVIELRSPGDRLPALQDKMAEYVASGTALGWLIDPVNRQVFVYRLGQEVERLDEPESLSGNPALSGFELRMDDIW